MKIKHFSKPFYHTIIYDYFDNIEFNSIKNEIEYLETNKLKNMWYDNDTHHKSLYDEFKVDSYYIDRIFENVRNNSILLNSITKIYNLNREGFLDKTKNPLLNFINDSNSDSTMLHSYKNGSSYYEHKDNAVLSFLYTFWDEPKEFIGGDLIFGAYKPKLKSNCCLIFPSYELHQVTKVESKKLGIVRWSLNQRIYIENR